ncbi:MAG: hypothetical protein A3F22_02240 [Candidatus Magasanikbacteria bacterium RIFCSPHIGHO2_12_FULL_41_16]|nr:MAG: hypothetical protein A3F22_02240 [Candidatus Magasanikbacteria bacterium RIFCSPHIGHO2_12_FULL_41_16]
MIQCAARTNKSLLIFITVVASFGWTVCVEALGISPSYTEINGVRNGSTVERTIFITRSDTDETQYYSIELQNEGKEFIHFKSNILKFSPGVKKVPLDFSVEPRQAKPKNYTVEILVSPTGKQSTDEFSFLSNISGKINFSVTDKEISDFGVRNISINSLNESPEKLDVSFVGVNSGNVPVTIDDLTLEGILDGSMVFNETIPIVSGLLAPMTNRLFTVPITKFLSPGNYSFKINIQSKGVVVGTATIMKTIGRPVSPLSTTPQSTFSGKIIGLGVIFVILCIGIGFVFRKKFKSTY